MSPLDLDRQVCHSLYSTANALIRAYRPLLKPLGLTYPQYVVMLALWQNGASSVKQISQYTRLDSGTLTPILKRLESQGLLIREHSESDERQKHIVLTKAGKKLKATAEKIPGQMACKTKSQPEKAIQLRRLCEELYQVLGEIDVDAKASQSA